MLSDQSRQNLIQLFEQAARSSLLRSAEHSWAIVRETPKAAVANRGDGLLLVITTSSYRFRLLTFFNVPDTEANRAYFVPEGSRLSIQESFAEIANLCCGALNREISNIYPHLAMSVPSRLSGECVDYLTELEPEFTCRFMISINGTVQVAVTLCMCCTVPVEFPARAAATQPATGELEMF